MPNEKGKIDFRMACASFLFQILNIIVNVKKGILPRLSLHFVVFHSLFMALVELSFQIKQQELSKKRRIKDDSKTALRKKRHSDRECSN